MSANSSTQVVLRIDECLRPRPHYVQHKFVVPEGAVRVEASLCYVRKHRVQLFLSLHDPDGFRGNRMNLTGYGELITELWVSQEDASPGGLPGPLPAGEWIAQIDIDHLNEEAPYTLEVRVETGQTRSPAAIVYPEGIVKRAESGWYRGELHCHSTESDGHASVEEVVKAAEASGLNFLALTDHFTTSQWRKLSTLASSSRLAFLRSCEITSHHGHANLHGLKQWVDVFVDRAGWGMPQAADCTHEQGGLFCVNHPFSGGCSWRDHDFDWSKADLMEIYHALEGPNNNSQISWWDHLLNQGYRIIGVGGTDSHQPYQGHHALGQLTTWVDAPELSEAGILAGLVRGNVYVSRGAEMRLSAVNSQGETAVMGAQLSAKNQPVAFHLQYRWNKGLRLFIFRNGLLWNSLPLEHSDGEWLDYHFEVPAEVAIFRVELHELYDDPDFMGIEWRDYRSVQALGNPIWLKE